MKVRDAKRDIRRKEKEEYMEVGPWHVLSFGYPLKKRRTGYTSEWNFFLWRRENAIFNVYRRFSFTLPNDFSSFHRLESFLSFSDASYFYYYTPTDSILSFFAARNDGHDDDVVMRDDEKEKKMGGENISKMM